MASAPSEKTPLLSDAVRTRAFGNSPSQPSTSSQPVGSVAKRAGLSSIPDESEQTFEGEERRLHIPGIGRAAPRHVRKQADRLRRASSEYAMRNLPSSDHEQAAVLRRSSAVDSGAHRTESGLIKRNSVSFLTGETMSREFVVKGLDDLMGVLQSAWWKHWTVLIVILYFVIGVCGGIVFGWSPVDSLYFTVVTVTTVGYGDMSPKTGKPFFQVGIGVWVLMSAFVIGTVIAILLDEIMAVEHQAVIEKAKREEWEQLEKDRTEAEATFDGEVKSDSGLDDTPTGDLAPRRQPSTGTMFKQSQQRLGRAKLIYKESRRRLQTNLKWNGFVLSLILLGGTIIGFFEGWTLHESFYWACVTISSVGYGDMVPTTAWGKFMATALMFSGVFLAASVTGFMLSYRSQMKEVRAREHVLTQFGTQFTMEMFHTLAHGGEVMALDLCSDPDSITRSEFCLYLLLKMGRISKEELWSCQDCFDCLDTGDDGLLGLDDVEHGKQIGKYVRASNLVTRVQSDDGEDAFGLSWGLTGSQSQTPARSQSATPLTTGASSSLVDREQENRRASLPAVPSKEGLGWMNL